MSAPAAGDEAGAAPLSALYPVLSQLPAAARERLQARARRVQVPAGTSVFDERQACQGFPFVLAGSIRVVKSAPNGRELPLYRVTPGETCIISSACLLGHTPYNARGVTETDTTLLLVPSAFTHTTGHAHWELLLRARAVENLAYVLAPAQGGVHENGRQTWGHSMLVDPWGDIVNALAQGPGVVLGELDAGRVRQVRAQLPALEHRVL